MAVTAGLGSLRWPAQCFGITTIKATYGRIPAAGDMQMGAQLAVVDGPMARHIADLWTAFEVMKCLSKRGRRRPQRR